MEWQENSKESVVFFEDIVEVLGRTFSLELKVVQGTTVFEVTSEDGGTKVQVLVQDVVERKLVLMSADLGEPPPDGGEKLYRTMLEANNLFSGTAGATLALDAATGRFRLQKYESPDGLANDAEAKLVSFIETALFWSRAIADFRHHPLLGAGRLPREVPLGDHHRPRRNRHLGSGSHRRPAGLIATGEEGHDEFSCEVKAR